MDSIDPGRVSRSVNGALARGGPGLVVGVLAGVPGVVHFPAAHGMFRSGPQRVQIGQWRYEAGADGRLRAAHVVGRIVLVEESLAPDAAGPHLARALGQLVGDYGDAVVPHIEAVLDAMDAGQI